MIAFGKMGKGGMATGKRNKEGRKRRKEQERVEYLDHQKRRLENYIKAEVGFIPKKPGIFMFFHVLMLFYVGGKTSRCKYESKGRIYSKG